MNEQLLVSVSLWLCIHYQTSMDWLCGNVVLLTMVTCCRQLAAWTAVFMEGLTILPLHNTCTSSNHAWQRQTSIYPLLWIGRNVTTVRGIRLIGAIDSIAFNLNVTWIEYTGAYMYAIRSIAFRWSSFIGLDCVHKRLITGKMTRFHFVILKFLSHLF